MKKTIAMLLVVCMVLVGVTGCSKKLSGTYKVYGNDAGAITFEGDQVTISAFGINVIGNYKIEGDKLSVEAEFLGQKISYDYTFKQSGDSIYLDGVEFRKDE